VLETHVYHIIEKGAGKYVGKTQPQAQEKCMATVELLSDSELSAEARAVFDDIRATRNSDYVNNFWRALAHDPATLKRTWENLKAIMGPGAIDPKVKEMIYIAVSVAHGCPYCVHSHTAAARTKGMSEAEYHELLAVIGMASMTNRLVTALGVSIDDAYQVP
jgi:AhpD family alkylhydroperoxidase